MPVDLGHPVRAPGVEGGFLGLGHLPHLPEHLAAGRLVEADGWVDDADGVEQAGDPQSGSLAGEHRLAERGLHERLGGQVVHLHRPVQSQGLDEGGLVEQVAAHDGDLVLEMGDALEADHAGPPDQTHHLVARVEQELSQVGAVLARDPGDQRSSGP